MTKTVTQKADDVVAQLVADISDKQKVLDAVTHLQNAYPDLSVKRDAGLVSSLSAVKFYSAVATKTADDVEFVTKDEVHGDDDLIIDRDVVYAMPFTTADGYKVYSNPMEIMVGTVNVSGFGVIPVCDIEEHLEYLGLPRTVVRKVREYLQSRAPVNY